MLSQLVNALLAEQKGDALAPIARPARVPLAYYASAVDIDGWVQRRLIAPYVGIMGVVEKDGDPLWYELSRRDLQPMIYFASRPESIFWALDVLMGSFTFSSSPRHVAMYVISRRAPHEWWVMRHGKRNQPWFSRRQIELAHKYKQPTEYFHAYGQPGTNAANGSVLGLAGVAEQRTWGRHFDGAHLLVIEDLADAWKWWSDDARANLPYILDVGKAHHIGVVAGLRYEDVPRVPGEILARFGWQVWGRVEGKDSDIVPANAHVLDVLLSLEVDEFIMNTSSDGWLKFYLPAT